MKTLLCYIIANLTGVITPSHTLYTIVAYMMSVYIQSVLPKFDIQSRLNWKIKNLLK